MSADRIWVAPELQVKSIQCVRRAIVTLIKSNKAQYRYPAADVSSESTNAIRLLQGETGRIGRWIHATALTPRKKQFSPQNENWKETNNIEAYLKKGAFQQNSSKSFHQGP